MNAKERRQRIYSNFRFLERMAKWAASEETWRFPKLQTKKVTCYNASAAGLVSYRIPTMINGKLKFYDFPFKVYRFPHRLGYFVQMRIAINEQHIMDTGELIIVIDGVSCKAIFPLRL